MRFRVPPSIPRIRRLPFGAVRLLCFLGALEGRAGCAAVGAEAESVCVSDREGRDLGMCEKRGGEGYIITYSVPEVPGRLAEGFGRGFSRGETGGAVGSIAVVVSLEDFLVENIKLNNDGFLFVCLWFMYA